MLFQKRLQYRGLLTGTKASRCTFSGWHSARQALAENSHHQSAPFLQKGPKPHPPGFTFQRKVFIVHLRRTGHHHASVSEISSRAPRGPCHTPPSEQPDSICPFVPSLLITTWLFCSNVGRLRPAVCHAARCTDITAGGIAAHQPVKIPHTNPAGCLLREDKFTTVNNPRWLIFAAGSRKSLRLQNGISPQRPEWLYRLTRMRATNSPPMALPILRQSPPLPA